MLSDDGYHDQDDRDSFRRGDSRLPLPTTDSSISSSSSWTGTVYHSHNDGASTGLFSWLSAGPAGWLRREGREEYPYEEQRAEHYGYARSDTSREDEKVPGGTYGKERVLVPRGRRPARSSRRFDTSNTRWYRRSLFRSLVIANCTLFALAYCLLRVIYIPQFSLKFDKRSWVETQFSHLTPPPPLHTPQCFDIARIERETLYNWTEAQVLPRRRQVNAGTGMNIDMTCYGAAKLVQPVDVDKGYDYPTPGWIPVVPTTHHEEASQETQRYARALLEKDMTYDDRHILPQLRVLNYHTYWRTDLLPFSERQAYTIQAFLATQPLTTSRLIMWTNSATILSSMPPLAALIAKFPHNIQVRQVDFSVLIKGTALEGNSVVQGEELYDRKGWIDGDAVRLLALYNFGGVWIDMDQVLTRDLRPLIEHEFLSQWDCEGTCLPRPAARRHRLTYLTSLNNRQTLPSVQRCSYAFPKTLSVSVRSISHHGLPSVAQTQLAQLGRASVPPSTSSSFARRANTIFHPSVVFHGSPELPKGYRDSLAFYPESSSVEGQIMDWRGERRVGGSNRECVFRASA